MKIEGLPNSAIFYHCGHQGAGSYRPDGGSILFGYQEGDPKRDQQGRIICTGCGASMNTEAGQRMCPAAKFIHIDLHRSEVQTLVGTFGNTNSGTKIRKKVNQLYGRQMKDMAVQAKRELDMEVARRLAHFNTKLIKQKPKWLPTKAWQLLQNVVLNSDTMV